MYDTGGLPEDRTRPIDSLVFGAGLSFPKAEFSGVFSPLTRLQKKSVAAEKGVSGAKPSWAENW